MKKHPTKLPIFASILLSLHRRYPIYSLTRFIVCRSFNWNKRQSLDSSWSLGIRLPCYNFIWRLRYVTICWLYVQWLYVWFFLYGHIFLRLERLRRWGKENSKECLTIFQLMILLKTGIFSSEKLNALTHTRLCPIWQAESSVLPLHHAMVATTGLMLIDQTGIYRTIFI